ncbi:uncharacterized protein [Nicotiana tomentosiformis]|uniref:uncharacterized protein n=1 Tax=Nicotiana tomentosiformis TaxID=4098 RepID=UPI00388CBB55
MPESSYRPPAIQGSSSGYSGHQGQTSGQQITTPRGCYECGDPNHVWRFCPRLWDKAVQQGHQPMITALVVRPPRGRGQAGRGHPRGGGQEGGGTISVCGRDASVLFDPGSTYSYVSSLFAHFPDIPRESLGTPIYVSTPVGFSVVVHQIYRSCVVTFCGYKTRADLLLLDMTDFEVILGKDWLSTYHSILDCHAKTVILAMHELPRLEWRGSSVTTPSRIISFIKARHMAEKGYLAYLAYVGDTTVEPPSIYSVPVVQEFPDVFPSDLPSIPPDRDINFSIDLARYPAYIYPTIPYGSERVEGAA